MHRCSSSVADDRQAHRSRRVTHLLALVVLIAWWTVALDCMSTRGFTWTAKVRPDRSWRLEPAMDGCQPDAHGASYLGTIANKGDGRAFRVDVSFVDGAGNVIDAATTRVHADANGLTDWIVHGDAEPDLVRTCTATATPVPPPPPN